MTILTKPLSEKKDKLVIPLVENDQSPTAPPPVSDVEAQKLHRRIIIFPAQARRVSSSTILCLLIIALAGVSVGIIGGKILYNEYLSVTRRMPSLENNYPSYQRFEGLAQIPLSSSEDDDLQDPVDDATILDKILNNQDFVKWSSENRDLKKILRKNYFQENFEIDAQNKYEKIDVPVFKNGRNGRFIHDFNTNYTGIIDVTGQRCFVMPLNRQNVLPPASLFDLIHKMWSGYYKVDTEVVRETMKVVTPPITDLSEIGLYISTECDGMPIYRLEKYVGGVVKRSAEFDSGTKFGQFAGRGILEFDIVNMNDVIEYEEQLKGGK